MEAPGVREEAPWKNRPTPRASKHAFRQVVVRSRAEAHLQRRSRRDNNQGEEGDRGQRRHTPETKRPGREEKLPDGLRVRATIKLLNPPFNQWAYQAADTNDLLGAEITLPLRRSPWH